MKKISAKRLKSLGGKMPWSSVQSKPKPIRKVNPKAKAKRTAGYRKMLSGKEYKAARTEAMARARNQCELWLTWTDLSYDCGPPVPITYTGVVNATTTHMQRCAMTESLHAHHKHYPKTRPLEASDLLIVCKPHHEYLESLKMHKSRMF